MERISIRRHAKHTAVNVTWVVGSHRVHHQVKVVGPTRASIAAAIKEARARCDLYREVVEAS